MIVFGLLSKFGTDHSAQITIFFPLNFFTLMIFLKHYFWPNKEHSLKYLSSTTKSDKERGIRKLFEKKCFSSYKPQRIQRYVTREQKSFFLNNIETIYNIGILKITLRL